MSGAERRSVVETFAGKHLLVTGVTGFLGKVWLAMILDRLPETRRITILVRGKKGENAEARWRRIYEASPAFRPLREEHGQALRTIVADKVQVIDARLVEPLCGMSPSEAQTLMADVDAVVHFAGLTDFEPDPIMAVDANIHAASHVADLAAMSPGGRYVHVSTAFVAGMVSNEVPEHIEVGVAPNGVRFDPRVELEELEAELAKHSTKSDRIDAAIERAKRFGWPNIYTYSKGLSEHLVDSRDDVKTTTVRPAIVVCAQEFPFLGWNEGVNTSGPIVWLLQTAFQRFPARPTNRFDVVPVDMVCRGMCLVTASALRDEAKTIYQVGSGHLNPLSFARAVDLNALAGRKRLGESESTFERRILRHLDPICYDADKPQVLGLSRLRKGAQALRTFLRDIDVHATLPPRIYEKVGPQLEDEIRSFSMKCRTTDRKLSTVEDMLRAYRPFIYEHDYIFRTDHLMEATAEIPEEERGTFGFDILDLDWRHYWMNVQVPGLEKWCIPLLRGEKVYDDPPLPPAPQPPAAGAPTSESTLRA